MLTSCGGIIYCTLSCTLSSSFQVPTRDFKLEYPFTSQTTKSISRSSLPNNPRYKTGLANISKTLKRLMDTVTNVWVWLAK